VTNATHNAQFTYDAHGALTLRSIKESTALIATSKIEEFSYDASGLIERYQVRKAAGPGGQSTECAPDASLSPRSDWRYRFGPMKEREQKHLYLTDEGPAASLPWVYYLLSPNKQQLAVYNGIEGKPCGGAIGNVYMWPVEYNAYGVGGGRVITRPDNTKRFVVTDHLGSVRLTYDAQGGVLETADFEPFGELVTKTGEEARTGYIGRETDNESDLGFNGVRLYDQQYGRFLSTDAMWAIYVSYQPYQYSLNTPLIAMDDGGKWVRATNSGAQEAIRQSVPERFRESIKFNENGFVDKESVLNAAVGQDVNSNIAILSRLAENDYTVEVTASNSFDAKVGGEVVRYTLDPSATSSEPNALTGVAGVTIPGKVDKNMERESGYETHTSMNGNIQVFVTTDTKTLESRGINTGVVAAHELYGHVSLLIQTRLGKTTTPWYHGGNDSEGRNKLEERINRVEEGAKK